jgi:hypothetical protein
MNRSHLRAVLVASAIALAFIVMNGCGSKESKWEGTYTNTKEEGTLTLQPEHKGTLSMAGTPGDITWEIAADDKITVHASVMNITMFKAPDGLRDQEGTVWKKK